MDKRFKLILAILMVLGFILGYVIGDIANDPVKVNNGEPTVHELLERVN